MYSKHVTSIIPRINFTSFTSSVCIITLNLRIELDKTHTRILLLSGTGEAPQTCKRIYRHVHGDMDELYEVTDEAHHGKADGDSFADLDKLCRDNDLLLCV